MTASSKNSVSTPGKERKHGAWVTQLHLFPEDAIKYDYYKHRERSTLNKLLLPLKAAGLYGGGKTSLWTIFKALGFYYCNKWFGSINGEKRCSA